MIDHRPRHLLAVSDLAPGEAEAILRRADDLAVAGPEVATIGRGRVAALLFLSSSLRTRVGHGAAAARLGLAPISIDELRWEQGMTAQESFEDTLRVVSGLADLIVTRTPFELDREVVGRASRVPLVNGGDGWNEHPTQALIDLHAITRTVGPIGDRSIGIVGDLSMHSTRSILRILAAHPPALVRLIAPTGRDDPGFVLPTGLEARVERTATWDTTGLDVVYLAGLPEGSGEGRLDDEQRAAFALSARRADALDPGAVVLCPLPRIDEISEDAMTHPAVRVFEQSDAGLFVRMAVIEALLTS